DPQRMPAHPLFPGLQFLLPPTELGLARARIAAAPGGIQQFLAQTQPGQRGFPFVRRHEHLGQSPLGPAQAPLVEEAVETLVHAVAFSLARRQAGPAVLRTWRRPARPADRPAPGGSPTAPPAPACPPRARRRCRARRRRRRRSPRARPRAASPRAAAAPDRACAPAACLRPPGPRSAIPS